MRNKKEGRMLKLLVLLPMILSGCAGVVLNNEATLYPEDPNPLVFKDPVCIHVDFKTDNIGFWNETGGLKEMPSEDQTMITVGLPYYNISIKCVTPVASFTVISRSKTRNWWARTPWLAATYLSIGIVPFYINEVREIEIKENDRSMATINYEEKKVVSILAAPKYAIDLYRSVKVYQLHTFSATTTRRFVIAIREAINNKEKNVVRNLKN